MKLNERPMSIGCVFSSCDSSIFGGPPLLATLRMYNIWMPWDLLKMDDIITICNYLRNEHPNDVVPS